MKKLVKKKAVAKKPKRHNCDHGKIIGYKKIYIQKSLKNGNYKFIQAVATLVIPEHAHIVNPNGDRTSKHRCSEAKVIKIHSMNGKALGKNIECHSHYDRNFKYKSGKVVKPKRKFSHDKTNVCESGIHFFLNKSSAKAY